MKSNELKGRIIAKGFSVTSFLERLNDNGVKIGKNTFYRNLSGEQEFTRKEIRAIADILELSDEDIIFIFFADEVA